MKPYLAAWKDPGSDAFDPAAFVVNAESRAQADAVAATLRQLRTGRRAVIVGEVTERVFAEKSPHREVSREEAKVAAETAAQQLEAIFAAGSTKTA